MIEILKELSNSDKNPIYGPERQGDVKHSLASIDKITSTLGYEPSVHFKEGLTNVYNWYKEMSKIE